MSTRIIRLKTTRNNKQKAFEVIPGINSELFECEMEYFDDNEMHLPDGDYPYENFEPVIIAASIVSPGEPTPVTNYRGVKLKKEHRRYNSEREEDGCL